MAYDFNGNPIIINDEVIFMAPGYRQFVKGTVKKITNEKVEIEYTNDWNFSEGKTMSIRQNHNQVIVTKPRKTGHWIITNDKYGDPEFINCSICGQQDYYYERDNKSAKTTSFCPHCGTIMTENKYPAIIYKDFIGDCNYSHEDNVYYGQIIGIKDLVTYESSYLEGMPNALKEAIEDYLQMCKELKTEEFTYKGFKSLCTYNPEDNSYSGEVDTVNAKLIYKGYSLDESEKCFQKAIDDYINRLIEENNENVKTKQKKKRKKEDNKITLRQVDFKTEEVIEEIELDISDDDFNEYLKLFCDCGYIEDNPHISPEYVEGHMGVDHGWICPKCKKFVQIG